MSYHLVIFVIATLMLPPMASRGAGSSNLEVLRVSARDQSSPEMIAQVDVSPIEGDPFIPPSASRPVAELSTQARQVSQIAILNGDQDFLMVDKVRGLIFLFQGGRAVFSDSALTGVSAADRFSPEVLASSYSRLLTSDEKVTPAGRFTVTRQYDPDYGTTFDINEIIGKDWSLAIHPVYLGQPYEKRLARLNSPSGGDNHITFGCINIGNDAIEYLSHHVSKRGKTPLYVLPFDEAQTPVFFPQYHGSNP